MNQQQQDSSQSRMTSASFDVSILNLASLSINNDYQHLSAQEEALTRGWGSAETRKAYASLQDLANCNHQQQQTSSGLANTGSYNSLQSSSDCDYFVGGVPDDDGMDCEDNFF
jgi:hypothetical protein